MTNEQYQESQNTIKRKTLVNKTKKIASTHAPTIGGALGFFAGGLGAGLTDGNHNTYFDVPVGISAGVGGAIIGTVLKQNYKSNSAEKKQNNKKSFYYKTHLISMIPMKMKLLIIILKMLNYFRQENKLKNEL